MAAIFVVGLPGGDMRIVAVALGDKLHDPVALLAKALVRKAVVAAGTELAGIAVGIDGDHVRMLVDNPARRRCGRCAEHDLQPGTAQGLDGPVQPLEVQVTGARLEARPGEFTDADPCQPGLGHPAGISFPDFFRPVFRIIAGAESAFHDGCSLLDGSATLIRMVKRCHIFRVIPAKAWPDNPLKVH